MPEVKWAELRRLLTTAAPTELLDLLRALFERSADNRRFLAAKLLGRQGGEALEEYRERIRAEFVAADPPRAPRLGEVRKAIRDYRKATGDTEGCTDLMLTYVEAATAFSRDHGDMGDAYYHSLGLVLRDVAGALRRDADLYGRWRRRLEDLRQASRRVGWTWGGHVAEVVDDLERRHA